MTEITIDYLEQSIELKGHTEDPVVCHGVSALTDAVANRLRRRVGACVTVGDGYMLIRPPEKCNFRDKQYYLDYLDFLVNALTDIEESYTGNLDINEI